MIKIHIIFRFLVLKSGPWFKFFIILCTLARKNFVDNNFFFRIWLFSFYWSVIKVLAIYSRSTRYQKFRKGYRKYYEMPLPWHFCMFLIEVADHRASYQPTMSEFSLMFDIQIVEIVSFLSISIAIMWIYHLVRFTIFLLQLLATDD